MQIPVFFANVLVNFYTIRGEDEGNEAVLTIKGTCIANEVHPFMEGDLCGGSLRMPSSLPAVFEKILNEKAKVSSLLMAVENECCELAFTREGLRTRMRFKADKPVESTTRLNYTGTLSIEIFLSLVTRYLIMTLNLDPQAHKKAFGIASKISPYADSDWGKFVLTLLANVGGEDD